jgi:hypothetical protein
MDYMVKYEQEERQLFEKSNDQRAESPRKSGAVDLLHLSKGSVGPRRSKRKSQTPTKKVSILGPRADH